MNEHTFGPKMFNLYRASEFTESSECYIRGKLVDHAGEETGSVFLVCERAECELGSGSTSMPFQQQMPRECLPEFMVLMRAAHLATHTDIPEVCICLETGSHACGGAWCAENCPVCRPEV